MTHNVYMKYMNLISNGLDGPVTEHRLVGEIELLGKHSALQLYALPLLDLVALRILNTCGNGRYIVQGTCCDIVQ